MNDKNMNDCENCNQRILVMCFQGQNYCSENCRKDLEEQKDLRNRIRADLRLPPGE